MFVKKLTKKQKKWISIGSVLGVVALTTVIVTPIVVVNEQNAYNNSINKYINARDQHIIRISEIVKIYNLNGHIKTRARFAKFLRDIKGKPLWLLSFKDYTSIIDAETYVTIQILPKTMPFSMENENIIYGGLLGVLVVNGSFYLNPFTNTKYTKQQVLNNYVSIQVSDPNFLKNEEMKKRDKLQLQISEAREPEL